MFDEAVATIDRALGLESSWKDAGRSDDEQLEQILRLYKQSVQRLDESMGGGALSESETAKLSAKRDEVAGRIKTLEVQRGPRLRSGSGNAYKDAVATLKDAATMDSRAKKGEPNLLVDAVRLYSHAIRLMLRAAQDPNCKQEVQRVMEQKIVDARKRIAILSTRTDDAPNLRAALDRDAAKFADLAPAEPNPEAESVKPLSARGGGAQDLRWCKRCKEVFEGSACSKGHPNYLYTHKLPADVEGVVRPASAEISTAAETTPARASPRSPRKVQRSSWDTEVEEAAPPTRVQSSTNEAQNFLQEQARLQKIKAAE